jgi:peptide/nickel transport system ATP-binding protein
MLAVEGLTVRFRDRFGAALAVEDVSLGLDRGEVHGLVGESGAGKSTIGAAIMGLLPAAGEIVAGRLTLGDTDLRRLSPAEAHRLRGKRISMIFQDPQTSLNPLMTIEAQLVETILAHEDIAPRRRATAPSACWRRSASPMRPAASAPIRTSSRAACASAWSSRSRSAPTPS